MARSEIDMQHSRRKIIRELNKLLTIAYFEITASEYDMLKSSREFIDLKYRLTDKELIERKRDNG